MYSMNMCIYICTCTVHTLYMYGWRYSILLCFLLLKLERLAKRLKKENVNVDVISFGEEEANGEKLSLFVDTLNGKEPREGRTK